MTPPIRPGPAAAAMPSTRRQLDTGFRQRALDQQVQHLDMGARCDFRHHAAEGRVLVGLRQHDIRQDAAAPVRIARDHRRRGLVAGRFDAEHDHPRLA